MNIAKHRTLNIRYYKDFKGRISMWWNNKLKKNMNFKEFNTDNECFKWGTKYYGDWLQEFQVNRSNPYESLLKSFENPSENLLVNEIGTQEYDDIYIYSAFNFYSGDGYYQINKYLRYGKTEPFDAKSKLYSDIMISEIRKFHIPENIVTYRVLNKQGLSKMSKGKVKKGMILEDKAFLSTGLIYKNLWNKYNSDCLLQILIPKGNNGLYIGLITNLYEQEVILPPNTKMEIIDIYRYKNKKVYKCILLKD